MRRNFVELVEKVLECVDFSLDLRFFGLDELLYEWEGRLIDQLFSTLCHCFPLTH